MVPGSAGRRAVLDWPALLLDLTAQAQGDPATRATRVPSNRLRARSADFKATIADDFLSFKGSVDSVYSVEGQKIE